MAETRLPRIFYTLDEVAEICGCSKSMVERYVYDRETEPRLKPYLEVTLIGKGLKRVHVGHLRDWARKIAGTIPAFVQDDDPFPVFHVVEKRIVGQ